ncbi:MAG: class I tRNA ligase family protein, partial [Peptoniphilus harei]|nr:class I tRNA ligase family protein [Peptoniphilus harei]
GDKYTEDLASEIHKTIKKVTEDYANLKANTAIAQLMTLSNDFNSKGKITKEDFRTFLILLNPVAPHITEELWEVCNLGGILSEQVWPKYDEKMTIDDEIEIPVQFNGKVRYTIKIERDASQDKVFEVAEKDELFAKNVEGKKIVKKIYIPNKIVNIVVK